MLRLRSIFFVLSMILLAPLLGAMSVATYVLWEMPSPQGPRLRSPHGVVGVHDSGAMMWVVPAGDGGVVLIDAGLDPEATALKKEVRDRPVLGILLTHAHVEQVRGLEAFPDVPVYIGEADQGLLAGDEPPRGWLADWFSRVLAPPPTTGPLSPVTDGQDVVLGEAEFRAVHVPGHTDGHIVWAHRDMLFTGGALLASSPLQLMPGPLSNDADLAKRSLDKLLPFDFDIVADGHSGFVKNGRAQLHRLLEATEEAATISLMGPPAPGPDSGPETEATGLLVVTPKAAGSQFAPVVLVLPDGREWVVDVAPAEVAGFDGRTVVVRGSLRSPHARPGLQGGLRVLPDGIVLGTGQTERSEPGLRTLGDIAAVQDAQHQWGLARGTIRDLTPLSVGATHAEGTFVLADGSEVPMSGLVSLPQGVPIEVLARVAVDGDRPWLTVHRTCDGPAACL